MKKNPTELTTHLRALEFVPNPTIDLQISATYFPRGEIQTEVRQDAPCRSR